MTYTLLQITDLRQRLAESQKTVLELEAEREQRQRDYDKKLLLAKSKIENVQVRTQYTVNKKHTHKINTFKEKCFKVLLCGFQGEKECLNSETTELKQKIRYLQDQLLPLSKQREYQEKEIQRLNRVSVKSTGGKKDPSGTLIMYLLCVIFAYFFLSGIRGSLKSAHPFILTTTSWPGQLCRRSQ